MYSILLVLLRISGSMRPVLSNVKKALSMFSICPEIDITTLRAKAAIGSLHSGRNLSANRLKRGGKAHRGGQQEER